MIHWQFYLSLLVFVVLINLKVKEGNFAIPDNAVVYKSPLQMMDTMKDIMDDKKTNDMVENNNLIYDLQASNDHLADANTIYARDQETYKTCKINLAQVNSNIKTEQALYNKCLADKNIQTDIYQKCQLQDLPKALDKNAGTNTTIDNINKLIDGCNKTLQSQVDAVQKCQVRVNEINSDDNNLFKYVFKLSPFGGLW
jgi:exonuclease VII small subunit